MKRLCVCLLSMLCFFQAGFCDQGNGGTATSQMISHQLSKIDDCLEASRQNVVALTQLKASAARYQLLQARYMQYPEDNEVLYQMIKEAHALLEGIRALQLTSVFDPAFISELTVVSKPVTKLGIPKP